MPKKQQQRKQSGKQITVGFKDNGYRERLPWQQLQVGDCMIVPIRDDENASKVLSNLQHIILDKRRTRKRPKPDKNQYAFSQTDGGIGVWRLK